jgi:hypothetical protein
VSDLERLLAERREELLAASGKSETEQVDLALELDRHKRSLDGLSVEEQVPQIREWVEAHPDWRLYHAAWHKARHA